jgi:hypothetical protein
MNDEDEKKKYSADQLRQARLDALKKLSSEASSGLRQSLRDLTEHNIDIRNSLRFPKITEALKSESLKQQQPKTEEPKNAGIQLRTTDSSKRSDDKNTVVLGMMNDLAEKAKKTQEEKELAKEAQQAAVDQIKLTGQLIQVSADIANGIKELTDHTVLYEKAKKISSDEQKELNQRTELYAKLSVLLAGIAVILTIGQILFQIFFEKPHIVNVSPPPAPIVNITPPVVNIPPVDFKPLIDEIRKMNVPQKPKEKKK